MYSVGRIQVGIIGARLRRCMLILPVETRVCVSGKVREAIIQREIHLPRRFASYVGNPFDQPPLQRLVSLALPNFVRKRHQQIFQSALFPFAVGPRKSSTLGSYAGVE